MAIDTTGYSIVSQTSFTEGTGAGLPFAAIFSAPAKQGGRYYNVQVKTGTLRINFTGATGDWIEWGPGLWGDNLVWNELSKARVDTATPFTAVLLMQGVL